MTPRGYVNVDDLAENVLAKTRTPRRPNAFAVDIEAIVRDFCRFDIAHVPSLSVRGMKLSGAVIPDYMVVLVDADEPERRKRFTFAHELGHAQIDFPSATGDPVLLQVPRSQAFRCAPGDVRDREPDAVCRRREMLANMFAARVLMPSGLVKDAWTMTRDLRRCADLLEVSTEAAGYRIRELGLV